MLENVEKCWKMLKNVGKCWKMLNVENIPKNVEMLKNVGTKIIFSMQIILFFDKEFKKLIINPYLYQHLFSSLVMTYTHFCYYK